MKLVEIFYVLIYFDMSNRRYCIPGYRRIPQNAIIIIFHQCMKSSKQDFTCCTHAKDVAFLMFDVICLYVTCGRQPVGYYIENYDAANYRPVSLTCTCCKTLEHILVSNINKHLALDSILTECRHGFRSRKSCETQLVQFVHDIISNLDGAMNRGAQANRFDHHGFRKGLRQGPTQEAITQTRLLWETRVHPQVDQLMALWAQSTSSFRRSSLRSSPCFKGRS